jgi:hypothetical protein
MENDLWQKGLADKKKGGAITTGRKRERATKNVALRPWNGTLYFFRASITRSRAVLETVWACSNLLT